MNIVELKSKRISELADMAKEYHIDGGRRNEKAGVDFRPAPGPN